MAPPAKRRRRNVVDASDDDDDAPRANTLTNYLLSSPNSPAKTRPSTASPSPSKPLATRPSTGASTRLARRGQSQKNGASPSPKKTRSTAKIEDKGKTADLKTLFSNQAQKASKAGSSTDRKPAPLEDIVSDPISEDDEISELKTSFSSLVSQHAKKRLRDGTQPAAVDAPVASHRFLKPPRPAHLAALDDDTRPWSDRFGPRNLEELAVHKKKVSDVRKWMDDVMAGRMRQRLLVLKGAAGSGKTTTVRLLAADMGCELLEWRNPTAGTGPGYSSVSAQFEEFLGRGGKFGALDTDGATPSGSTSVTSSRNDQKRIILIEEFPNTFSRSSSTLVSFRNGILRYLAANTPSLALFARHTQTEPITPVIMVISETLLTTTSASADSFTAHRLLGPEILGHPGLGLIEFNAIAPTLLAKALELVVLKEARKSGRRRTPGPQVLKQLGDIGDIRSAISSLEFLCLKGDNQADWGANVAFSKQRKGFKDGIKLTQGEVDSLELVSQRGASLGIFHAVGKVVYNKRDDAPPPNDTVERLPAFMSQHARPKRSEVSVDTLIDETGTDTETFISALHENFILSCESPDPMDLSTPIDYISECIEYLSLSDLLSGSQDVFFGGRNRFSGRDSSSHVLRHDDMTFQVAVRGMLFALPSPVKRKKSTGAKGSDAFKMFYPTSLKLWRDKEEVEGLVDVWSSRLLKGEDNTATKNLTDGASAFRRPQPNSEATTWMQRQQQARSHAADAGAAATAKSHAEDKEDSQTPLLSLGSAARREMLLERMPYMAHMARARKASTSTARLRELEKVVSFRGVAGPSDDHDDGGDDDDVGEAWATDRPSDEASPRKKKASGIRSGEVTGLLAQKLVLSDDDIED